MSLGGNIDLTMVTDERFTQAQGLNDAAMAIFKDESHGTAAPTSMLRRSLVLNPHLAEAWSNLGLVLWRAGDVPGAHAAFRTAVTLKPYRAIFHGNLGVFLGAIGALSDAEESLREALRLNDIAHRHHAADTEDDQTSLGPKWDLCLLHLRNGDWRTGLAEYDIRREHKPAFYPKMPAPMWRGENLDGRKLYVQGEQGVGDRFLFSRYLWWVKSKWPTCRILVCLYDPMINVFWEFRHIVEFLPQGVPWPEGIDYGVFLCSLPQFHGTTIDNVLPDPGLLRRRVLRGREKTRCNLPAPNLPSLKIGLCWTGNPAQTRNADRRIPLEMLLPLAEDPRLTFYSFQCSPGQGDIARLGAGDLICDLGPEIEREGWVQTGIALMEMDLLLTVCTSVPHLAGAIGVPTWTMLCADPYWIWSRTGDSTPWYPGMRLFRQTMLGDWAPVIAEVRAALTSLANARVPMSL